MFLIFQGDVSPIKPERHARTEKTERRNKWKDRQAWIQGEHRLRGCEVWNYCGACSMEWRFLPDRRYFQERESELKVSDWTLLCPRCQENSTLVVHRCCVAGQSNVSRQKVKLRV